MVTIPEYGLVMSPEEIREALAQFPDDQLPDDPNSVECDQYEIVARAARAYADLLERGQEMEATRVGHRWGGVLLKPGRYLVVRVEDDA